MGRIGVSYLDVAKIATELHGMGVNPTVDTVRERLQTGSRSTIGPYLKQWRDKHEEIANSGGLPPELFLLIKGLYDRIHEIANAKIDLAEKAANEEILAINEKLEDATVKNKNLENEIQSLITKISELTAMYNQQTMNFENEQKKNLSLSHKIQELEMRLQDKNEQMQLLGKQLNNVQSNLEHYRESMVIQRENEKRAWERTESLLNQEIKELKHQNIEYNKSNQILNQNLQATQEEKNQLQRECLDQKGRVLELQEHVKNKEYLLNDSKDKYTELSALSQKFENQLKQNQIALIQLEKEDLVMKERFKSTEIMLRRAEDIISSLQSEKLFMTQEITVLKTGIERFEKTLS